ncbi:MAG: hypothetical protein IBX61_00520 [Thermoleophilia bacterium]|nr:hypothetical protein [Thermoleophilia bacterium]
MLQIPKESSVQLPLITGVAFIALGFFFFESLGAFLGHYASDIRQWQIEEIQARPESIMQDGYPIYTVEQAANIGARRLTFFHGHGYLMVLATSVFLILIALAPGVKPRIKGILMWVSLIAMLMYNIGWGVSGMLLPYLGVEESKTLSERLFFIPFGLTIVVVTGIIAFVYGVYAIRIFKNRKIIK